MGLKFELNANGIENIQDVKIELRAKARELRELNTEFKTQAYNLEMQERSLVSMEGEAGYIFDRCFEHDRVQMDYFYDLIEGYCTVLETMATRIGMAKTGGIAIPQRFY